MTPSSMANHACSSTGNERISPPFKYGGGASYAPTNPLMFFQSIRMAAR